MGQDGFLTTNFHYLDTNKDFFLIRSCNLLAQQFQDLKQQHRSSEGLQKVQNQFQLLFQKLKILEEACGIYLQNLNSQKTSMALYTNIIWSGKNKLFW